MRFLTPLLLAALLFSTATFAKDKIDSSAAELSRMIKFVDSVNGAMKYETGTVRLSNGIATLNIPAGFKFLNAEQSQYVITEIWGNPQRPDVLGMLFPQHGAPFADSSYAFIISYDAIGHVKDDDADEIDYDAMLKEMQDSEAEVNKERTQQGFGTLHFVGWAQKPFYDKNKKVLHWAKEIHFGDEEGENTLNYDIRLLGRKGVLSFNAVAGMSGLELVKQDIDKVLAMPDFTEGNKYSDFNPDVDQVAAYTVGGLVAGKVLAKAGLFALLLKFWKLIVGGIVAVGYGIRKFFGRKKEETYQEPEQEEETTV
ncbi:DUF2167 domain-containing protein [Aridibaculum aurantiacum]|uniref:DUF2167 domain-containing protein n=1 Tax=Aridibaculum aurantiacum TaxID=2810307 RepID=UPI001A97B0BB|nr:DUF2167 domain-containing protein [Aridibaculum aurantiacum]